MRAFPLSFIQYNEKACVPQANHAQRIDGKVFFCKDFLTGFYVSAMSGTEKMFSFVVAPDGGTGDDIHLKGAERRGGQRR